jgi:hypothetical protein
LCEIIRIHKDGGGEAGYPNFADKTNRSSREIAWEIVRQLGGNVGLDDLKGQTAGGRFEEITKDFLEETFQALHHLRPGEWLYTTKFPITKFFQYEHLATLTEIIRDHVELASALGQEYIIAPDIVIGRHPISDDAINSQGILVNSESQNASLTPLRGVNYSDHLPLLHASISCKWTIRSDRSQNARTEALNLIRNRKGHVPHIAVVTAEPLPTRVASVGFGTGDLDCVYHFALHELEVSLKAIQNEDQLDMFKMLVDGRRLRDISDLPFDLIA